MSAIISKKKIPFAFDRKSSKGLVDQAVEGFKAAILGGYFAIGESLPSQAEFAREMQVSLKVPRQAYARLAKDGWIARRYGLGYAVASLSARVWKGRVLVVCFNRGIYIGLANIGIDRQLTAAGYLVSYAYVTDDRENPYASLDAALSFCRYDIIYSHNATDELISRFENAKIPYVLDIPHRMYKRCMLGAYHRGSVLRDEKTLSEALVKAVKRSGVKSVLWVDFQDVYAPFVAKLRRSGIDTAFFQTPSEDADKSPAGVRAGACRVFDGLLEDGSFRLPEMFLFTDDCVADGVLMALALHGVAVPRDVRVVTLVNRRIGLAYPRSFTRLEVDSERIGETVAGYLLGCIHARKLKPALRCAPVFVEGDTL